MIVCVSKDFSLIPAGRNRLDTHSNARTFFEKYYQDMHSKIIIDFSDCLGVGSSFLHELCGLLVSYNLHMNVTMKFDSDFDNEKYERYILAHIIKIRGTE